MKKYKPDDLDRKITTILEEDATISDGELAKMLGRSRSTINLRKKRLIKHGYIKIIALPNEELWGYPYIGILSLSIQPPVEVDRIAKKLSEYDEVQFLWKQLGDNNLVAFIRVRSQEELIRFIEEKINVIPEVKSITYHYIYETIKATHKLPFGLT